VKELLATQERQLNATL